MKRFFSLLLLLPAISLYSQEKLPAFGKADRAELNMKECVFEKTASAMRLIDEEEKEVVADFGLKIKSKRRTRIKIFNQDGFDAANITIHYFSKMRGNRITDIDAYIYYLDSSGKEITEKVNKSQIFRDKADNYFSEIKFTFPNVRPGCVIEYSYEKVEKNSLDIEPWYFQDMLPTLYSAFTLSSPADVPLIRRLFGEDSILVHTESERGTIDGRLYLHKTYVMHNIIAFNPEPMMSSISDNLKRLEFYIQPSGLGFFNIGIGKSKWDMYAHILNVVSFFGGQFDKPIPGTESIIDSTKKMTAREDKISYIFQQVKKRIKWDKHQTFYAKDLAGVWKDETGNSADINLTILNLLRKSGIPCSPLMISTRMNGKTDENFYSLGQFNGVDVGIIDSSANYVLDGTRKYQSYKTPPENILNRYVFNADTAYANWAFITDTRPLLKTILNVSATLSNEGQLEGSAMAIFYDHSKVIRMMEKKKSPEEEKEEEKELLKKDFTELKIDSLVIENEEDDLQPLVEKFVFSHHPSESGKYLFIDPFFLSSFRKNPFSDSARNFSIDFSSKQYLKTTVRISIPDNYEIDHLPVNTRLRMADSSILFERVIYIDNNSILFVNKMEILYPLFEKDEYPDLKEFFNRMFGMITEQIILKKKK
jgi:Domain of Unknown Function with PDB structure (DUF3857)